MFCGECGAAVAVPRLVEPQTRIRPGDTAIIQPLDLNASVPEFLEPDFSAAAVAPPKAPAPLAPGAPAPVAPPLAPVAPAAAVPSVEPIAPVAATPPTVPPVAPPATLTPAETTPPRRIVSPAIVPPAAVSPAIVPPAAATPPRAPVGAAPIMTPPPAAVPSTQPVFTTATTASALDREHDDVEATRIVRNRQGDRFVLQFSTGENSTVFGTGLVGRNPVVQPGEFVDHLVTIVDPGKSVSKTHLEFGQAAGAFWVVDRFSANGTVVRQPDARPQRLDPGKRQIVARGTRVDIGEQFFVVS
jgi:hypothetical protein